MSGKYIPFNIVEGCKHCQNALRGFNNITNSQMINNVEIYLRKDGEGKGWHISGYKIDGLEFVDNQAITE